MDLTLPKEDFPAPYHPFQALPLLSHLRMLTPQDGQS